MGIGDKMFNIILCKNCKKDSPLPFKLEWTYKQEWCDKCHQSNNAERSFHFCSSKCLKEFVNKFDNHKCVWKKQCRASLPCHQVIEVCEICETRRTVDDPLSDKIKDFCYKNCKDYNEKYFYNCKKYCNYKSKKRKIKIKEI